MKGIIFTLFSEMVESRFGLTVGDDILTSVAPESGGVYTSGATYPDEELFNLLAEFSKIRGMTIDDLLCEFGYFTFFELAKLYPIFFQERHVRTFLKEIDSVVHMEVKKLYPDAVLPLFQCEDGGKDRLILTYTSQRKLCKFAEGLLDAMAVYFEVQIQKVHARCMLRGDDHCRFELTLSEMDIDR